MTTAADPMTGDEWDENEDHCHRTDGACTGRSCWVCQPTDFTSHTKQENA